METVEYGHGPLPYEIPSDAIIIEITPYLWPGHYGEWDEAAQSFTAWNLVSPSSWRVSSEILAPPLLCLSVGATVSRWHFRQGPPHALQEFHVEFRQSSQLSDLSQTDQLGRAHPPELKTHPESQQTHPGTHSKIHPGHSKTHPESQQIHPEHSKTHPELQQIHPEQQTKHSGVQKAPSRGQEAVWRIHTRIHTRRT